MAIDITLSSANMGDVDETDFDLWRRYVSEHVGTVVGIEVASVEQQRFGEPGNDIVTGGTHDQREAIRSWLSHDGWDQFCGQGGPWEKMRREEVLT